MVALVRALYDYAGDPSSNTPAFAKGEIMTLITQHPNGWLEVEKTDGTRGYVSPAWVEGVASNEKTAAAEEESSPEPTPDEQHGATAAQEGEQAQKVHAQEEHAPTSSASTQGSSARSSEADSMDHAPRDQEDAHDPNKATEQGSQPLSNGDTQVHSPSKPVSASSSSNTLTVGDAKPQLERKPTDWGNLTPDTRPLTLRQARAEKPAPPVRKSSNLTVKLETSHEDADANESTTDDLVLYGHDDDDDDNDVNVDRNRGSRVGSGDGGDGGDQHAQRSDRQRLAQAQDEKQGHVHAAIANAVHGEDDVAEDSDDMYDNIHDGELQEQPESDAGAHAHGRGDAQPPIKPPRLHITDDDTTGDTDGGGRSTRGADDNSDAHTSQHNHEQQQQQQQQQPHVSHRRDDSWSDTRSAPGRAGVSGLSVDVQAAAAVTEQAPKSAPVRPRPKPRPGRPGHSRQGSHADNIALHPADADEHGARPPISPRPKRASVHGAFHQQLEATLKIGVKPPRPPGRTVVTEAPPPPSSSGAAEEERPVPFRKAPAPPPPAVRSRRPESMVSGPASRQSPHSTSPHLPAESADHSATASPHPPDAHEHAPTTAHDEHHHHHHQQQQQQQLARADTVDEDDVDGVDDDVDDDDGGDGDDVGVDEESGAAMKSVVNVTVEEAGEGHQQQLPQQEEQVISLKGHLERKLIREGGKDVRRRQWHKVYAAVEGPLLVLFGSKKDFEKQKKPTSVLDLMRNDVLVDEEYTKRDYVFKLEGPQNKMLFQAGSEGERVRWLQAINRVKTGSSGAGPAVDDRQRAHTFAGSRREKRSPKQRNKRHSYIPDMDAGSPKEKDAGYGYVRRRLNKYLRARPKKQELVSKGIIEFPVFGGTISHQVDLERSVASVPNVPIIVVKCVHRVERSLQEQGIYRVPGNSSQIQHLVAEANADCTTVDVEGIDDVHGAAGLLKLYFRELADPPFTDDKYADFIAAGKMADAGQRLQTLKSLFQSLPEANKATLLFLFQHLERVAAQGAVNKMHLNNLAIVFGPTLLRSSEPTLDAIVMDAPFQSSVVEELLRNQDQLA